VRELCLEKGKFEESNLYKLKKSWILKFKLGPSLLSEKIALFTNYPIKSDHEFESGTFYELPWEGGSKNDQTSMFSSISVNIPGSFRFFFTLDHGDKKENLKNALGGGYFLVDPELQCKGKAIPLDSIVCQTVLSKNLGTLDTWLDKLEVAHHSGYNMVHFTPIQTLGDSNSAYSLASQLSLNKTFSTKEKEATFEDIEGIVEKMRTEWGILSACDIVLNHTANETPWLSEEPSATYNMVNSPHLRPAYLLDRAIYRLTLDIFEGKWVKRGISKGQVTTGAELDVCAKLLEENYIPKLRIHELFTMDVDAIVSEFATRIKDGEVNVEKSIKSLEMIQTPDYHRLKSTVDMDIALEIYNLPKPGCSEEERQKLCCGDLRKKLIQINTFNVNKITSHIQAAVKNVISGASYERVDPKGPRVKECSAEFPLVCQYFTSPTFESLDDELDLIYSDAGSGCMAHNGWVMGDDPLKNFALPGSHVYLRRELVAWGDSVKLRYGDCPEDSPFLWDLMKTYTCQTSRIFDGIRLDNCHSTPIHVASWLLDNARKVRPDLYVFAELFTGSPEKDNIFVNKLGITSLIREGLSAWDSHELGRLAYRYGGEPVGSFSWPSSRKLVPGMAHALFLDQSHDNPCPITKRTAQDSLTSAGLVFMSSCAVGSTRGYDELVPHHIHVVSELREYPGWKEHQLDSNTGIIGARKELSKLHQRLAEEGFTEIYVDQLNVDCVAITRHCPKDRRSVIMVAYTHFNESAATGYPSLSLEVEGQLEKFLFEAKMVSKEVPKFVQEENYINGLKNWCAEVQVEKSDLSDISEKDGKVKLDLSKMTPGSLVVVSIAPLASHQEAIKGLDNLDTEHLEEVVGKLTLLDVQYALYECDQEGNESGAGAYGIPNWKQLNYCGLEGLVPVLDTMRLKNDLGHPLAGNLRDGDWMLDYIISRLTRRPGTFGLSKWLGTAFSHIRKLPRFLIPAYFDTVITNVASKIVAHAITEMSPFISTGSDFVKKLAVGSVIHMSSVPSAPLPPISSLLDPPRLQSSSTLAAGLPHFSTGYMRSWGRDTFISLRGLLLVTGRFVEARDIILGYAGCLRHGLMPNLLDRGVNARFNCRDAIWWWLRAILDYIEISEDYTILKSPVLRLYPRDDSPVTINCKDSSLTSQPLADVIHEALQVHFNGLKFRERNAGQKIDEHMTDLGFNNEIGVDPETGFVFGGNVDNCGTWMDKMGSSQAAGNKGKPSSPRDGSAVEIVGLSYSCLKDLSNLNNNIYPHKKVTASHGTWTIQEWANKIKENFDRCFWIGGKDGSEAEPHPDLVNIVEMYKDSVGSGNSFTDYQLRPNYPIALAVAPELVNPEYAWKALGTAGNRLLGPLGMSTLDSKDWAYRGDYDNSNQGTDPTIAHGANYHQGPEWVWPVGFFLRAYLAIGKRLGEEHLNQAKEVVRHVLSRHYSHLSASGWRGLPELTNRNGAECGDSNPIQAWSMATLLDVLYDLETKYN